MSDQKRGILTIISGFSGAGKGTVVHRLLEKYPEKLEQSLFKDYDDDGVELSGGEAQKIAIARGIYKDAALIILDEPTAALDPDA